MRNSGSPLRKVPDYGSSGNIQDLIDKLDNEESRRRKTALSIRLLRLAKEVLEDVDSREPRV